MNAASAPTGDAGRRADGGVAAVVLAGGRSARMGGEPKPLLEAGGRTLLARAVDAVRSVGCAPIVVVGPDDGGIADVVLVREDPPFGGPASAIAAALAAIDEPDVLVLAADIAHPERAVAAVLGADRGPDGAMLADAEGREQWLAAVYRTDALRGRAAELGDPTGVSMRAFAGPLVVALVPAEDAAVADIDTWEDFERLAQEEDGDG